MNILLELFWSFFQVGLFTIGGGYASLPLIQNQIVEIHGWMTMSEFTDLITIAEMTPGPIAINSATFVGTRVAGLPGAIISTVGSVTPSCIIVSILAYVYYKYNGLDIIKKVLGALRPAIVALIANAGLSIFVTALWGEKGFSTDIAALDLLSLALFVVSIFILRKFKPNPIYVMVGAGAVGAACQLLLGW